MPSQPQQRTDNDRYPPLSHGKPRFFLKHFNGQTHAEFYTANSALACQRGLDTDYFHFENVKGETITLADQPRHPGHAYAILAALDAAAKTGERS